MTVLVRKDSKHSFPDQVKVVEVDYLLSDSIRSALGGHHILISALGKNALHLQRRLIDVAVDVEIQRIIPSEFGADLRNPKIRSFPTYAPKVDIEQLLEHYAARSATTYTLIYSGTLLDWGIWSPAALLLNGRDRTVPLYDGGDIEYSTTTMITVGRAVVAVLNHYEETANRAIYIQDAVLTQNRVLNLVKDVRKDDGGKEWAGIHVDTAQLEADARRAFENGEVSPKVFYSFAIRGSFAKGYGGQFSGCDNGLLGISELDDNDIRQLLRTNLVKAMETTQGA